MDASKEGLIRRLLKEGKITQDEAYLLQRKEQQEIQYIPALPANPFPQIGKKKFISPQQEWANEEMNRRMRVAENCACNPANGGSGVCGCTLASPVIYS